MIDAKLKGEGVEQEEPVIERSNVIDLMAALKKSLGQVQEESASRQPAKKASSGKPKKTAGDDGRRQPGLKLPIAGGKKQQAKEVAPIAEPVTRSRRKA